MSCVLHAAAARMALPLGEGVALPGVDAALADLIENERFNLNCVGSCARSKDCPIVYASYGFYELTGCAGALQGHARSVYSVSRAPRHRRYTPEETIGRNCRFLQGRDTERNKVRPLRRAPRSSKG